MSWIRRFSSLPLALLLTVGVGCTSTDTLTEAPVASSEQSAPQFGLIGDLTDGLTNTVDDLTGTVVGTLGSVTDLLTCSQQPYAVTRQSIGPNGGVIRVGSHTLTIPGNAVTGTVLITAEQVPGSTNSVRFSPEGLQFKKAAALTMSYDNCAVVLVQKKIVYTDENLKILEVLRSLDLFRSKTVTAPIDHFSRYALAY
ncbi:MAG TPA: hypothetical protein VE399_08055 [Gemmatimonadales bacterium]|nr:hypothetical protein [Gemmatimonadales bacterium]